MKKLLLSVIMLAFLAPTAFAGDFDHGISPEGCYYYSETHEVAYNKDASAITDVGHCASARSTVWYMGRVVGVDNMDAYYNRIQAMKVIIK